METRPPHSSVGDVSFGLPHKAIPVSRFETGAVSGLTFDVRFGSEADIRGCVSDVRFTPESRHGAYCTG